MTDAVKSSEVMVNGFRFEWSFHAVCKQPHSLETTEASFRYYRFIWEFEKMYQKWFTSISHVHLFMCAGMCRRLTQTTPADHVRWHRPQLPLSFDVLQQALMEAPGSHRVGFQFTGSSLPGQPQKSVLGCHYHGETKWDSPPLLTAQKDWM